MESGEAMVAAVGILTAITLVNSVVLFKLARHVLGLKWHLHPYTRGTNGRWQYNSGGVLYEFDPARARWLRVPVDASE